MHILEDCKYYLIRSKGKNDLSYVDNTSVSIETEEENLNILEDIFKHLNWSGFD